jgi:hypothetical protein
MTKNPKLAQQFNGPGEIIDINDTNAKVTINNKIKVLNVNKLKFFSKKTIVTLTLSFKISLLMTFQWQNSNACSH